MNNQPRQTLTQLINQYGPAICDEPLRLKAMLRDLCDQHKREVNILGFALDERIPHDLLNAGSQSQFQLPRLSQRLQDAYAMSEGAAKWAVESWALALGVLSTTELNNLSWQTSTSQTYSSPPSHSQLSSNVASQTRANSTAAPPVQTLIVDQQGGGDYTDISDAIQKALPGARIMVRPGVYYYDEGLVIDKPVEIVGDGPSQHIIIKGGKRKVVNGIVVIYSGYAVLIKTNDVFIINITIQAMHNDGIVVQQGNGTLEKCSVFGAQSANINIKSKGRLLVRECSIQSAEKGIENSGQLTVEECEMFNCRYGVSSDGGSITIQRCKIHDMRDDGVYIRGGRAKIEECDILRNSNTGVHVSGGGSFTVRKCNINQNCKYGINSGNRSKGIVENCDVSGNAFGAWSIREDSVQRHGNKELTEQEQRQQEERQRREREERERRERQQAEWRAAGRCEMCGEKLGFLDRLFGEKRCQRHR